MVLSTVPIWESIGLAAIEGAPDKREAPSDAIHNTAPTRPHVAVRTEEDEQLRSDLDQ